MFLHWRVVYFPRNPRNFWGLWDQLWGYTE